MPDLPSIPTPLDLRGIAAIREAIQKARDWKSYAENLEAENRELRRRLGGYS